MARLSDADQSRFPVPRLDPGRADRTRPGAADGSRETLHSIAGAGNSGVVKLLLQVSYVGTGPLSRARSVHSVDEAEEHPAALEGRGTDHASGAGVLRLGCSKLNAFHPSCPGRMSIPQAVRWAM